MSGHPDTLPFVHGPSAADWDELERPLAVDPVTFEVLRHKLEAINEEQGLALKAVSASPVVSQASVVLGLAIASPSLVKK